MEVRGNVIATGTANIGAVEAIHGGVVTVYGNVIASVDGSIGVNAKGILSAEPKTPSKVEVKGNVEAEEGGVSAAGGSEIHVNGSVIAGKFGISTIAGSGNPKVIVDGDVTATGQGVSASAEVEAVRAGGSANVTIGGNVTAERTEDTQIVTAVYANGSTIDIKKNVTTQGSGVNAINGGKVTIEGTLNFNPTGTGSQSYIKLGYPVVIKSADDFDSTNPRPGYKEYKNGENIVWVKGVAAYTVTFNLDGGFRTGGGELTQTVPNGGSATAPTVTRNNYTFIGWDKAFNNVTSNLTVIAKWSYSGGGTNSGRGRGSSEYSTPITIRPEKNPDWPVIAEYSTTPATNNSGHVKVTILQKTVSDAIAKAQSVGMEQGKTVNGIGVAVNIDLPNTFKSLAIVLPRPMLDSLIDANVKLFEIDGVIMSFELDLEALKEIRKQSKGDVTITIVPAQNLSPAVENLVGTRPAYGVTISYVREGETVNITSFIKGSFILSIPYMPEKSEAVGWLIGVYVEGKDQAANISGSAYDANSGSVIFPAGLFSIYGVGYTVPIEKYTDISDNWAKESIDYVVGRRLFAGTTDTTFSPNTAMDRGMLVTVLGRLANADVTGYKTSSFSDVVEGKYYLQYVEWAYKNGIVIGTGNNQFEPERAITREEIALILQNYSKTTGYKLPVTHEAITFADNSSIGSSYTAAVKAMQQAGIMMGGNGNKFNPKLGTTRAEVAAILHRYIKLTIDFDTAQGRELNDGLMRKGH